MKGVKFDFPTDYEDTSVEGDKLWDKLMPSKQFLPVKIEVKIHVLTDNQVGSGFVRVPYPRRFDMPASKPIDDDPEKAEIYSLSALHQLHCLVI